MKKFGLTKTIKGIALFGLAALNTSALAYQEGFYAGAGVALVDTGLNDAATDKDVYITTLELIGGYKYDWYLGGEARLGTGVGSATFDQTINSSFKYNIDYYQSLYYKMEALNDSAKLYLLMGYTFMGTSWEGPGESNSTNDGGVSIAAGFGFTTWDQKWNINFEARTLIETDTASFRNFGMTFDRRF